MRVLPNATVLFTAIFAISGPPACVVPVMHPFRTHEGPGARVAVAAHVGAEDEASCDNFVGCRPEDVGGFSLINIDARWGHMLGEHVGILGGTYFPGFRNSKSGSGYAALVGYGVLTAQGDVISFGAGPEVGSHVIGGSGGLDIELVPLFNADLPQHFFAVTGYGRYLSPYTIEEKETNGRVPSWDTGGSLRIGPVVLQYAYYRQTSGVIDYVIYETSIQAQSWHIITLGLEVNADTLDFETPSDRERERLRKQRQRQREEEMKRREAWERLHPKPVRKAWPGCDALCQAQSTLNCGVEEETCIERCKAQKVPASCWDEDDAVMLCQSYGARCHYGRLWLPGCDREQRELDLCVRSAPAE